MSMALQEECHDSIVFRDLYDVKAVKERIREWETDTGKIVHLDSIQEQDL